MGTRVALYMRVSTARQAEKELSIPDQRKQLRDHCEKRGYEIAGEYVEPGASATDDKRPVFQEMMDAALGQELATLAGGASVLAERAQQLCEAGDLRLACHLVELAALAEPQDKAIHAARAAVFQARRDSETSLMAKGIYGYAAGESLHTAGLEDPHAKK